MNPEGVEDVNRTAELFRSLWPRVTSDSNITLHGFRRFKTTHLVNLRFLEEEIAELDRTIYQAGLRLGHAPSARDRLGLKHGKIDPNAPNPKDAITREMVLQLRSLIKQYGSCFIRVIAQAVLGKLLIIASIR